ncbi:ATP-binding protein [Blastococcus sp. HT6-30]|uniref:sensor histidine kinase n=1 Tax=Blastococcus sp. HT6-30 TaxID=3144843 RepID=UPI00321C135C
MIWRQLDTDRTLAVAGVRWALAGGVVVVGVGLFLLLATTGQLANARNGFAATLLILTGVVLATAPAVAAAAGLPVGGALRPHPVGGARRRRRPPARLGAADPGPDPAPRRRAAGGQPARAQPGARAARLALRPAVVREGGTWAGLVAAMVAEVEADHALTVDSVVVGDAFVDEDLAALGAAAREALVNAAKHSGAASADVYTEVAPEQVSVFVRDRGKGFDPGTVPDDRRGLRDSVHGRLARLGGTAQVRSTPGEGTEVELVLPRRAVSGQRRERGSDPGGGA